MGILRNSSVTYVDAHMCMVCTAEITPRYIMLAVVIQPFELETPK